MEMVPRQASHSAIFSEEHEFVNATNSRVAIAVTSKKEASKPQGGACFLPCLTYLRIFQIFGLFYQVGLVLAGTGRDVYNYAVSFKASLDG